MHNNMKDLKDLFRTSCQLSKSMKIEAVTEENPTPDEWHKHKSVWVLL